jgi:hypothetical protein
MNASGNGSEASWPSSTRAIQTFETSLGDLSGAPHRPSRPDIA